MKKRTSVTDKIQGNGKGKGTLQGKLIVIFVIMVITMSVLILIMASMLSIGRSMNTYSDIVEKCANYTTMCVDGGEEIDEWLKDGKDEFYDIASEEFEIIKELFDLEDLYIYYPERDAEGNITNNMVIVMDTLDDTFGSKLNLGYVFGQSRAYDTICKVFETGKVVRHGRMEKESNNMILAAFAPIKYSDGRVAAVVGAELDASLMAHDSIINTISLATLADLAIAVFAVIMIVMLRSNVIKPLNVISGHMKRFVADEGSLDFEPITEIHTNDEIEQIADDFNSLAQRTIEFTQNLEVKTTEEERLRVDLDVASQIRRVISSETVYPPFPERSDFDLCASLGHTMYNRCSFCNYFLTDTGHLHIVLGESLGNGLASMLFTILSVTYIKSFAKMGFEPYKIAAEVNNQICSIEKKDNGLTVGAVIIEIDLKSGLMKYVNAGMPPVLLKKPGEELVSEKANLPFSLGQMRGISFEQNNVQLYQGSSVLLTSFGISEACDRKGSKYGMERLVETANRISGNVYALNEAVKELESDVERFRGDAPVAMDTAVVAFRYYG